MKLLLEGSLSETLMLKDLLAGILQAEAPGRSVLKLCIASSAPYGEFYFLGGNYVVGAKLNETDIDSDEALNHLLQLKEANFYYYTCDSLESLPTGKALKVDLKGLIESWQTVLPLSSNELLDKIFEKVESSKQSETSTLAVDAPKETAEEQPFQPITPVVDKSGLGFTGAQSDVDWNLVNPLLVGGAPGDNAISLIGGAWEDNASATQGLRSLLTERAWQHKLRDLVLILVVGLITLIVICCIAWLVMNSPSSDVNPRRFSVHTPKRHITRGMNR